ncbi:MucBP domain-containing protein [Lactococcus lactis]|uniref:MucBP domain-containing protein n=1 Tax=Lactococcus lactis TaxID=1358 RepID=UPI0022E8DA85|nr:MucBP domain-containing protein [Lactococcus lactis]
MKNKTTLIALGILASSNILPIVANAEDFVSQESPTGKSSMQTKFPTSLEDKDALASNTITAAQTKEKSESQQNTKIPEKQSVNNEKVKSIISGDIEFSANSTEFSTGDQYKGVIHLVNETGNTIHSGTKIIVAIPSAAVDYNSWDFSDTTLSELFDVSPVKDAGTITFTLKSDIVGVADITIPFSTLIIGPENSSYPVTISAQNTDGTFTDVAVKNDQIIIPKKDDPTPSYGLLNMYWGTEAGSVASTFLGKNPVAIDGISTGVFSRKTNDIQNFLEINPEQKNVLNNDEHYQINYEIKSTKNLGAIDLNNIEVLDVTSGIVVPESEYTVKKNNSDISFVFLSPNQSSIQANHKYVINITSLATNDGDVYNSKASLQVKKDSSAITEENFSLNNIFTSKGSSVVFPNISANNKVYNVGELTSSNIIGKLMIGVSAADPIDGNLSNNIKLDYKDLLSKKDTVGVYPEQVNYSVTNSLGYSSSKDVAVTITNNQKGKDVTAKYIDTEGNKISDDVVQSGIVGDDYSTDQKDIDGYTFKEVQGDASGKFTDQAQTVTYVYTKRTPNDTKPTPAPDDHSDSSQSGKDDSKNNSGTAATLPQTGENGLVTLIAMFSGFLLTIGSSLLLIFKHGKREE